MSESEVYRLMATSERVIQDDPEDAFDRGGSVVQQHNPNIVIVAWKGETAVVSGTDGIDKDLEILTKAKRFDKQTAPLRAHLTSGAKEA
ncbi:hypothetical protein [Aurantimonas sp. HBX-1]|uniref:hypothetical protein n=1 Tax=Aurantimonas sp. HBX-1 TaxID=2906072 RepID=UPI001F40923B|nr:hypothetical protein [Aurantimonas sp. HBX-1]UIJ73355.1 hypothetical protein LXB15_06860 [Aurantimonas sp. HBX-1]